MNRKLILCLALTVMVSMGWAWDGTVINVNRTNTTDVTGSTNWWKTTGHDSIPLWREWPGFGLAEGEALPATATSQIVGNGEIYQARDAWGDDFGLDWPTLKSNPITLPNTGEECYVYVFFWSDYEGHPWRIRAALSEPGLATSLFIGGADPSGPVTPIQVGLDSDGLILWAAQVGYYEECTGQTITIYTDDEPNDNSYCRSWLDAYGYGPEVPEPMTIALLGLGGLFLRRRR